MGGSAMSKQWGHGFYKGAKAALEQSDSMAGIWFHSRCPDGKIVYQGQIIKEFKDGTYLIQLYEWFMGHPSKRKIVGFEEIKDWDFYGSDEEMRLAYSKEAAR
jgi:hypothetical protein